MMEADGEWSDGSDDALKSGSATGVSDGDGDVGTDEKKVLATNRLLKTDPVNAILDRIDAELGAMNIVSPSQSKSSKSSPVKKPSLDTNQILVKPEIVPPTSTQQASSLNNVAGINGKDKPTKNRSLDQVKEGEQYHSDLDSLAAEQIDEKFKEIMKKKRGGYLDDLNTPVSDAETLKTTDIKSTIVHSKDLDSLIPNTSTSHSPSKLTSSLPKQNGYSSDLESIQTEDFESKFAELLVKDGSCSESMDGKTTLFDFKEKSLSESLPKSALKTTSFEGTNNITPQKSSLKSKVECIPPRTMLSIYGRNPPTGTPTGSTTGRPSGSNLKNSEKSPVKSSGEKTKSVMFETDSVDETCREIERESARIQLEMGRERRANSPTRISNKPEYKTPSPVKTSTMPSSELLSVTEDDDEKQAIEREVKLLREALHCSRLELRECQTNLKETREKAENARTQLMLTEFKRNNADKDLTRLTEELEKQKNQNQTFDHQLQGKLKDVQEFRSLGMSVSEVINMKEEYNKLKMKSRNYETVELERDELVRQLNLGKDDLFHEQKQARIQKEELQLELESITSQLEEVQSCRDELQQTLSQLQSNYSRLEMEKNDILQKKSQEFDVLNNSRRCYDKEMVDLQQEVQESKIKMADLQERNNKEDELNLKLKDQNIELQQLLAKEEESREVILQDHKRLLLNFRKETDAAMMQLRESLFLEKQTALENLRDEIENDRRESVKRNDEKLAQILTENAKIISSKNDEITHIQTLLKNLEDERRQMEQKLQEEIQKQVSQAVTRERNLLETEKDWAIRRERDNLITENNRKVEEMSAILQQERNMKEDLQQQIKNTQKELEEQRNHNRQASKDKMVAVARAKEMMREQTNGEIERIKDKVKEDNKREIEELKETVKNLEEEIQKLRSDKQQLCRVEREVNSTLDRTERTVINEINEECRRSASVLGISPRKVHLASFRAESPVAMGGSPTSSKYRTPVTSSLANLRACNEELRTHLHELKQELDSQKSLYNKSQKDKEDSLENLKRKLEKEKSSELDQLKERLVREHITQMNRLANQYITEGNHSLPTEKTPNFWKNNLRDESPEFYIKRYEQEINKDRAKHGVDRCPSPEFKHINDLQQDEINRLEREIQKLALHRGNRKPPRPKRDIKTVDGDKLSRQTTVDYQPIHSNNFYTGSVPDLTNPDLYRQVPLRARLSAERESMAISLSERIKMDEQQAPDPELTQIFTKPNQKMSEMNKLQNTLTSQNKELMELERAYNQLNRNYDHRSQSPSLHFR